ncbi:MAG: 2-C-methyl-D-erythritol 4-phosphate cytidylyltransferase [Sciscionella sp.]|nr:2-C-methyl-D-erythritol 4-phosphate cytidylyltransferase [Sciscionella sp.]
MVLASGSGSRVGARLNKVYLPIAGRPLVWWSLTAFASIPEISVLLLVIRQQDEALADEVLASIGRPVEVVHGGASRTESEVCALRRLASRIEAGDIDAVLLHDAARPMVRPTLIDSVLRHTRAYGGVVPGLACADIGVIDDEGSLIDLPRRPPRRPGEAGGASGLITVQTPQGFRAAELLAAYRRAERDGFTGTDTAACVQHYTELPVRWVAGDRDNIKVTYPHDLAAVDAALSARMSPP